MASTESTDSTMTPTTPMSQTASAGLKSNSDEVEQSSHPTLGLPAPSDGGDTAKIDVGGEGSTVSLDHLGPIVVNQDGTLSRISNWDKMTETEKRNTLRVLGKRNRLRMEKLKAAGAGNDADT